MMRWRAVASLLLLVAVIGPADGLKPRSARHLAKRDPCQLLRAIFDRQMAGDVTWSISIEPDGCTENASRVPPRPTVLSLGDDELIGWEQSCGDGVGGPYRRPSSPLQYYYIALYVKDRTTLRFDVTPAYSEFDKRGRESRGYIQGCSSFVGEARLADGAAP